MERENNKRYPWALFFAVVCFSAALHLLHFRAVPLFFNVDSASYLSGALTFADEWSLRRVPPIRGPVMALLLGPVIALAGPYSLVAIKIFLHMLGVACVALAFAAAKDLMESDAAALACGLACACLLDQIYYASLVLSEVPSAFAALVFIFVLVRYLRTFKPVFLYASILALSFAVLMRPENLLLTACLVPAAAALFQKGGKVPQPKPLALVAVLLVAILPVGAWCLRNQFSFGFFGLSNYTPVVLYDGFLIKGEECGVPVADPKLPSMRYVLDTLAEHKKRELAAGRPWSEQQEFPGNVYCHWRALNMVRGLSHAQAMRTLGKAATDSMRAHPLAAARLVVEKIRRGMRPPTLLIFWTFPLPGEQPLDTVTSVREYYAKRAEPYRFALEKPCPESLVRLQRRLNFVFERLVSSRPFRALWAFGLAGFVVCPLRRPRALWIAFTLAVFIRALFPLALAGGIPRNFVPGVFLYVILSVGLWQAILARAWRALRALGQTSGPPPG